MLLNRFLSILLLQTIFGCCLYSQVPDSSDAIKTKNYLNIIDKKVSTFDHRINSKTEKTLQKLSRWETKIKVLLQKADPATADKLFAENKITFNLLYQKYKTGELELQQKIAQYNQYRDKLNTSVEFIAQKDTSNKTIKEKSQTVLTKMIELELNIANQENIEQLIKERKKELMSSALKVLGKNKNLAKINKETYYYVETIKNYKEIFSDQKKTEETVINVLNKIPAFKKFASQNNMLSGLFGATPVNSASLVNLQGLQTRSNVNTTLRNRLSSGGANAQQIFQQNMREAQARLNTLKNDIIKGQGGNSSNNEMPDFKPNSQKSKTFKQRLEMGFNYQFGKPFQNINSIAEFAFNAGYKLNDRSIIGLGVAYKLGYGEVRKIQFSNEGVGLRSFVDWKIKKMLFFSGGYEWNYFKNMSNPIDAIKWQQSGLIGITKKIEKNKKSIKAQILYDLTNRINYTINSPWIFRMGYNLKK